MYYIIGILHIIVFLIYRRYVPSIDEDIERYISKKASIKDFVTLLQRKDYRSVFYYRLPFVLRHLLNFILRRELSCYIHTSNIGGGLFIQHGYSTIIVAKSIGKNCYIHQNVTIGWGKKGKPTIGDNVSIYPGAVISDDITIGNNVRIAANTVVRNNIPNNCLVYGNPNSIKKLD